MTDRHGSAEAIFENRQAMYLAHSRIGGNVVFKWLPDPDQRNFFIGIGEGRQDRRHRLRCH